MLILKYLHFQEDRVSGNAVNKKVKNVRLGVLKLTKSQRYKSIELG